MSKRAAIHAADVLRHQLEESFDHKAWHGPNLRGSIRGLTARQAAWRPGPGRHNIWEIIIHLAYWKYIVRRRLLGVNEGSFPYRGTNWFKRPERVTEQAWRTDIAILETSHRRLMKAISSLSPSELGRRARGSVTKTAVLVSGIASHDLYHAGQIRLLRRLMK